MPFFTSCLVRFAFSILTSSSSIKLSQVLKLQAFLRALTALVENKFIKPFLISATISLVIL